MTPFFAHTDPGGLAADHPAARWQPLAEHLLGVADRSRRLALEAGASSEATESAWWAGLLHDLGKYQPEFQRMLHDAAAGRPPNRVPHSAHGAALALSAVAVDVAFAVAGHHAGLTFPSGGRSGLKERCVEAQPTARALLGVAAADIGARDPAAADRLRALQLHGQPARKSASYELRTRLVASCLIDADRLDTAGRHDAPRVLTHADALLGRTLAYIDGRSAAAPVGGVRDARRTVLDACLEAAAWPERLLSLTVPTGGGKTLASMAFALRRAALGQARRVIVVIPYLSIIEQNAREYARALGPDVVLEHHSGVTAGREEDSDERQDAGAVRRRLAQENWDAPVIVTTSVRFFETLFSNHTADLRRLHNMAGSVVVLDEVQTLPRGLVRPALSVLRGLAEHWGTTVLFCTATQPAFERRADMGGRDDPRWPAGTMREVIPDPPALFARLRRVRVEWPAASGGAFARWDWDRVASEVAAEPRALCVVNVRRHAAEVYGRLHANPDVAPGRLWHLSTRMCPEHRLHTLDAIRRALDDGGPCVVVSTQLIEAGVDVDFPVVFRAMAPLDGVAQAAGRCDREGRLTAAVGTPGGRVVVFEPDVPPAGALPPDLAYRDATAITRQLALGAELRLDDPAHVRGYFDRYYQDAARLDEHDVELLREQLNFPAVAENAQLINDATTPVIVPYTPPGADEAAGGDALILELAARQTLTLDLVRRAQRFQVGLYDHDLRAALQAGMVQPAWPGSEVLVGVPGCYRADTGFTLASDAVLIA